MENKINLKNNKAYFKYEVLEADVTNPFAFTVTLLNVPMLLFTVARVSTVAPVASPVCVALLTNPEYKLFTALSPVFVPERFATAPLASIAFVIAPAAIEVALPTLVTTPVKFALVVTVLALPVNTNEMSSVSLLANKSYAISKSPSVRKSLNKTPSMLKYPMKTEGMASKIKGKVTTQGDSCGRWS